MIESGRVSRISVAVLVDGTYTKNDKGEVAYQERPKEEIDRIGALVRSAIGFDQKRGDQVEVINLRFAEIPSNTISEPTGLLAYLQFTKDDIMHAIELAVMFLLAIVVLLFVVRPLVRRIIAPEQGAASTDAAAAAVTPAITAAVAAIPEVPVAPTPSQTTKMIEIAQVQGKVHAQSVQKVGELADRNPNETVSIIRQWLHEAA